MKYLLIYIWKLVRLVLWVLLHIIYGTVRLIKVLFSIIWHFENRAEFDIVDDYLISWHIKTDGLVINPNANERYIYYRNPVDMILNRKFCRDLKGKVFLVIGKENIGPESTYKEK